MRASEKSASPRGPSAGIALALEERHADGPDRRRRAARDRPHPPDPRGRAHRRDRRLRRRDRARARGSSAPRADLPRHPPAGHERARGLRAAAERSEIRRDEDRDADRGGAGIGHRPRPRRRRESLSDETLFARPPALARRERRAARVRMAARVGAAPGDDLTVAYRRLNAAYQQTLRYAEDVRRLYQQVQRAIYQSLLGLANALEAKDAYTRGHSERVGAWSRGVAAALGLPPGEVDMIGQAGLLHDIGKIGIPEGVLRKPGALDPEEWTVMRNHPLIGAQIVAPFDFFTGGALMIRHHHERWDGSGYPDGLAGDEILLGARIIAVADVYDALTSNRPYRAALSHATALEHLTSAAGLTLDEDAVSAFVGLIEALSTAKPDVGPRSALRPSR